MEVVCKLSEVTAGIDVCDGVSIDGLSIEFKSHVHTVGIDMHEVHTHDILC